MAFNPIENQENYVVDHIDSNRSNNNLENLRWTTSAQNTQFYYSQNEKQNFDRTSVSRPITFTNINTGFEYQFSSIAEGVKQSGFTNNQIKAFLSGIYRNQLKNSYGNFTVRYTDGIKRNSKTNNPNKVRVIQYDLNGNYIKIHDSITEAANSLNCNFQNISKCCKEKANTAYGFIWKYEDESRIEMINTKEVVKFDINGIFLCIYKSIADAEKDTGISNSQITSVCKGTDQCVSAGNFLWMYKEEYDRKFTFSSFEL